MGLTLHTEFVSQEDEAITLIHCTYSVGERNLPHYDPIAQILGRFQNSAL